MGQQPPEQQWGQQLPFLPQQSGQFQPQPYIPSQFQQQHSVADETTQPEIISMKVKRTRRGGKRYVAIVLLIVGAVILLSAGIWTYLVSRSQKTQTSQWVHVPPGTTPTIPANGYLFKDTAGRFVVYYLPSTLPATITWTTYYNQQDGYSIDYPSNWIRIDHPAEGHSGWALYPPGTNLQENVPGSPSGIGFRWISDFQVPSPNDPSIADYKTLTVNGVNGHLYTQTALGSAIIAYFPHRGGSFVITVDATSDLLMYVFQHMLTSLKFS